MRGFIFDVRYACRSFRRSPGFSVAAVLVLGIGIGAITLMFTTLNTIVLRPLPYPQPERLVWGNLSSEEIPSNSISAEDLSVYREQAGSLESLAALLVFRPPAVITGDEAAERVITNYVSANLFSTLGVVPQIGRSFLPDEEGPGEAGVVIISHGLWQRRFGREASAVGRPLTIDGRPYEVAGVMPAWFDFPRGVDIWFPIDRGAGYTRGWGNNNFNFVGRLRNGVTLAEAQAEVDVIAARIAAAHPAERKGWGMRMIPLHERLFGSLRHSLSIMMGLIVLVPLIACANVAVLFLARASDRGGELAVRLAIGGSRARIVRQLLTEGLVIALVGGAVGVVLTSFGGDGLRALAPATMPRLASIGVDGTVLAFSLLVSLATVPLFAVVPALRGTRLDIAGALKAGGSRGISGGRATFRNGLVVAQVASSLVLMIALGLFFQSYVRMQRVEPGFDPESVLTFELSIPELRYDTPEKGMRAWSALHERIAAVPGVISVGSIDRLPVRNGQVWNHVHTADHPPATPADRMEAERRLAAPGLFRTLGVPLLAGRAFGNADRPGSPPVVVINQTLAEQFFPGESPLGRKLVLPWNPEIRMEVIGVVGDLMEHGPDMETPPTFYMAAWQRQPLTMQFAVRTAGDPLASVAALRAAVRDFDVDIPLSEVATMRSHIDRYHGDSIFRASLVGLFAVVALLLTAIGLYGVLVYFVRQRAREISIRLALGARTADIFNLVVGRGMAMVGLGVVVGIAGGLGVARFMRNLLFGIAPNDAVTYGAVSICLAMVALLACLLPARRAMKLDPADVLKAE